MSYSYKWYITMRLRGPGGQGEQAKSAEEEAASRGLEARVAEIGDAPKVMIKLAVGWSPKWLKLHRKW